ncbi:MAG: Smr/MutS family protein [candidate division NC10 bacterium]|nr:Smr/MutS family protein [candidate division NC10 bacterium]
MQPKDIREEEPVKITLEDSLDLHAFAPQEIREVVEEYLLACRNAGFYEVRLIHGRGIGVQRRIVQSLLQRLSFVKTFQDAPAERGGWGATLVYLQPPHRICGVPEGREEKS